MPDSDNNINGAQSEPAQDSGGQTPETTPEEKAPETTSVENSSSGGRFCANCGAPMKETDTFCGNCGMPVNGNPQAKPSENGPQAFTSAEVGEMSPTLSLGEYLLYIFLFSIPFVGIIAELIIGFVNPEANRSRANFARAYLVYKLVIEVIFVIIAIMFEIYLSATFGSLDY